MNEIDDNYDSETELLDQNFFEGLETGKDRKKSLKTYITTLDKLRTKRETEYKKYLEKRKKEIWKKKKKKEKKEKFKHLEVTHFEFEFNLYERTKQRLSVTGFRIKRFLLLTFWNITPNILLYWYYTFKKDCATLWELITNFYETWKTRIKKLFIKLGLFIWKNMKWLWKTTKKIVSKTLRIILFWRKKADKEEEGEEKKEGETGTEEGKEKSEEKETSEGTENNEKKEE